MADEQNCEIRESVDDDGSTFHWIDYCPLHAKAGEMKEMLKGLLEAQGVVLFGGGRHMGRTWLAKEWEKGQALIQHIQDGREQ